MEPDTDLRALAHPVRLRMLSLMWAQPHSATDLARALGIGHGLASQHLARLRTAGLVEFVEVRPGRGVGARLFRTVRGRPLSEHGADGTPLLAEALSANLRDRSHRRGPGAAVVADADLRVPLDAWAQFRDGVLGLLDHLHDRALAPDDPAGVSVGLTVMAVPTKE